MSDVDKAAEKTFGDVLGAFNPFNKILLTIDADALKVLGIARQDLPVVANALAAGAGY